MDSTPPSLKIYEGQRSAHTTTPTAAGQKLHLEDNDIDGSREKALFVGCSNEGGSRTRVDILPATLSSYNLESTRAEQRTERALSSEPALAASPFHLWLLPQALVLEREQEQEPLALRLHVRSFPDSGRNNFSYPWFNNLPLVYYVVS